LLVVNENEWHCQAVFRGRNLLGQTYRGLYLGTTEELPQEAARIAALEKVHERLSDLVLLVEGAMTASDYEIEPLVPIGALDYRGRP
jgi:hypothetical protein